jgi:hypothetical protein
VRGYIRVFWDGEDPADKVDPSTWGIEINGDYVTFFLGDTEIPMFTISNGELHSKIRTLREKEDADDAVERGRTDHPAAPARRRRRR